MLACGSLLAAETNVTHVNTAVDAITDAAFATALDHSLDLNKDVKWEQGQGATPVYTPAYLSPSAYSEGWDFVFDFADGTVVSAQIAVSNFGKGKHRMLVLVKLTDPDGREMTLKNGRDRVDWFKHQGEFDYEIAKHHFWKQGNTFYFRFSHPTGDIDLTAVSVTEPLDLGVVWSGGKGYQYANIFAPRMRVSGRYRTQSRDDGTVSEYQTLSDGYGHGLRHITSSAMGEASGAWLRGFASGASTQAELSPVIDMRQLKNGNTRGNIRLLDDAGEVIDDLSFETEISLLKGRREDCCSVISVSAISEAGILSGTIHLMQQVQQFNVVNELKPFERFFVSIFKTPVNSRYRMSYDLNYNANDSSQGVQGQGLADLMTLE